MHSMYIACIMHLCTCVISMRIMHNTCYIFYIYIITVLLFFYVSAMILFLTSSQTCEFHVTLKNVQWP